MKLVSLLACLALAPGCADKKKQSIDMPPSRSPTPAPSPSPTPAPKPADMPAAADVAPLATASNTFAFELWRKAAPAGNAAMSPASITTALAMTWGGAKAGTADEMRQTLHLPGDPEVVMTMWGQLSRALQDPRRPMTLRIANRLFGEKDFKLEAPFVERTRDAYGAPIEAMDFKTAPDAARASINTWVAKQTEQRIKDLLPPRSITEDTRLVLVNAIYFLADWATQFEKVSTVDRPFHVSATDKRDVPTMHQQTFLKLAKVEGVKVLELPYKGGAAMLVILPDKVDGLAAVEQSLDAAKLDAWRKALADNGKVMVALPKFTIDPPAAMELVPALKQLGMTLAFDPKTADLTGIGVPPDPSRRLFISAVFHKAFVKVDEKGTEAAAATAVVVAEGAGAAPSQPEPFIADHPFLFAIVDQSTGLILFLGRVVEPKA